jgi:hypothetical protein
VEDGDRKQHAPVKYPNLSKNIVKASSLYLGTGEYKPVVSKPKTKLCSMARLEKIFVSKSERKTPKVLRLIATVDDKQDKRLKEENEGDIGVLRWDQMEEYLGPIICATLHKSLVH